MRSPLLDSLTPRQRQALSLALTGMSNSAVASRMYVSPQCVAIHLNLAYSHLGIEGTIKGKRTREMALLRGMG